MSKAKKISNKGLKAIFGENLTDALNDIESFKDKNDKQENTLEVKIKNIRPNPYQPRKIFKDEDIKELAASIKEHGLVSPVMVVKDIKGYTLVAGERRLRAHQLLKKETIKVVISDISEQSMEEIALIENIQRENLNSIEEAVALEALINKHNLTQENLAQRISKSRTYVTNALRLLKLPKSIQRFVLEDVLTTGHAKALLGLQSNDLIIDVAKKAIELKWSVRATESFVNKLKNPKTKKGSVSKSNEILYAEGLLRDKLSTKVSIKNKNIVIKFTSISDLNRILKKMDALEK